MKGNEFNDLWEIISRTESSLYRRLPERFLAFVKDSMVPGAEPDSGKTDVSEAAKQLLAALYLTYWAESAAQRRSFAEQLREKEPARAGEGPGPLTEEEYQAFLRDFDDWNELFGPIPFWAQSRGWQPEACYEIAAAGESADITADETGLKEVYVDPERREVLLSEARGWVVSALIEEEEELYWHDNDTSR